VIKIVVEVEVRFLVDGGLIEVGKSRGSLVGAIGGSSRFSIRTNICSKAPTHPCRYTVLRVDPTR
jgi:hypothetical protein